MSSGVMEPVPADKVPAAALRQQQPLAWVGGVDTSLSGGSAEVGAEVCVGGACRGRSTAQHPRRHQLLGGHAACSSIWPFPSLPPPPSHRLFCPAGALVPFFSCSCGVCACTQGSHPTSPTIRWPQPPITAFNPVPPPPPPHCRTPQPTRIQGPLPRGGRGGGTPRGARGPRSSLSCLPPPPACQAWYTTTLTPHSLPEAARG